jgi:hypothetical protein
VSCFLFQDSRETRTNLTDSFRRERGGQFESGFQLQALSVEKTGRPLKIYKQDGKGQMIAMPPKLKVIKSC